MELRKIKEIKELQRYRLPFSKTIFVFDFKKQEKEIDLFLKDKEYVAMRTDAENGNFCPNILRCPSAKAKAKIRDFTAKGYAVIVHEQNFQPEKYQGQVSGNVLVLDKFFFFELMKGEPLTILNRDGEVGGFLKVRKSDGKVVERRGKNLINGSRLRKILRIIAKLPNYKMAEFTIRPREIIFWQIKTEKSVKNLKL